MDKLIERLKSEGANFALEQDIWCEVYAPDAVVIDPGLKPPRYTTSIDAALTLLPDGWGARITVGPTPRVELWSPDGGPLSATHNIPAAADTAALALCIAALKARSSQ